MLPPSGYGNFIENHQNGLSNGSHPFELNYSNRPVTEASGMLSGRFDFNHTDFLELD